MAYERHDWECGEAITIEKLNNIEDGIEEALECCGGEEYLITFSYQGANIVSDRTVAEIVQAYEDGKKLVACLLYGDYPLLWLYLSHTSPHLPYMAFFTIDNDSIMLIEVSTVNGQDVITSKYSVVPWSQ